MSQELDSPMVCFAEKKLVPMCFFWGGREGKEHPALMMAG